MVKKVCLLFLMAIAFSSCLSKKDVYYVQGIENADTTKVVNYGVIIKADDILNVVVSSTNYTAVEAVAPFNQVTTSAASETINYIVDGAGLVKLPILGEVQAGGLTKKQFEDSLKEKLLVYLPEPVVNVRIVNFKYNVLGEVRNPGQYVSASDRVSIFDAIATSGDLLIRGERKDVTLIRENNGVKTHYQIDLTDPSLVYSENYYLQQNDILYVKPGKLSILAGGVPAGVTLIVSAVSLGLAIISFINR